MGLKALSRLIAGAPDYESGTWTPTIAGATVAGVQTYAVQNGVYIKLGKLVVAWATITMTAKDGATSGNILIAGLPYMSGTASGFPSALNNVSNVNLDAGYSQFIIRVRPNGKTDAIMGMAGDNVGSTNVTDVDIGNDTTVSAVLIYQTDL
ncbi:MAG: hypothetical protein ABJ215_01175 [Alphaproteobacteria bacterium]